MATLEELRHALATMPDPRDIIATPRELDALAERRAWLQRTIRAIEKEMDSAEIDEQIAALQKWVGHLTSWRSTCVEKLAEGYPPGLNPRQQHRWIVDVTSTLSAIDRGNDPHAVQPEDWFLVRLMTEAGYVWPRDFAGSLPVTEERLAALVTRRDDQHQRLSALLDGVVIVST